MPRSFIFKDSKGEAIPLDRVEKETHKYDKDQRELRNEEESYATLYMCLELIAITSDGMTIEEVQYKHVDDNNIVKLLDVLKKRIDLCSFSSFYSPK